MCTVTLIPKGKKDFVLTSSRDEAPNRKTLEPDFYMEDDTTLLYPKDELAGGTWIGISEKKRMVCLLNGGFTVHHRQEVYRLSRGIVVKEFLLSDTIKDTITNYELNNIEPFTIVVGDWQTNLKFYELVWDGKKKHFKELPLKPIIWSSSTLYSESMKQERTQWFQDFKMTNELDAKSLMTFHKSTHTENKNYGIVMDRCFVKTTSITQIDKTNDSVQMSFLNLQTQRDSKATFSFTECAHD